MPPTPCVLECALRVSLAGDMGLSVCWRMQLERTLSHMLDDRPMRGGPAPVCYITMCFSQPTSTSSRVGLTALGH